MANYNHSLAGTKSSGVSTVNDWTNANCYPPSAISTLVLADNDTIVFDELLGGLGAPLVYVPTGEVVYTKGISISTRYGANGAGVIYERTSGGTLCTINPDSTAEFSVNDVKFSSANISTAAINLSSSLISKNVVFNNSGVIGSGVAPMGVRFNQENGSVIFNDFTFSGSFAGSLMFGSATLGTTSAMTVIANGIHLDNVVSTATGNFYGILLRKGNFANNVKVELNDITGEITSSLGQPSMVEVQGCDEVLIERPKFKVTADTAGSGSYGILIRGLDATNRKTDKPIVRNGTVQFHCLSGDAISFGQDVETGLGYTTNPLCHDNDCEGKATTSSTPHGIVFRGLGSGKAYRNHCKRFHSPLMLSLCTNDAAQMFGNLITDVYGANAANRGVGLSYKGNSGGLLYNNMVIITPNSIDGDVSTFVSGIWMREQGATANSAAKAYSNNIIILGFDPDDYCFANVGVGDAGTLIANNYYTDGLMPSKPFTYNGSDYSSVESWNLAQESGKATNNPTYNTTAEKIIAAFGDLSAEDLAASLETGGFGIRAVTNGFPETFGELIPAFDIDQGIQSKNGRLNPHNL